MPPKKEINIFSVSFLDLLSGALAAVIILFVIIPKTTREQQEINATLEQMEVNMEELQELLDRARNSIATELYEEIRAQMEQLRNLNQQLNTQVEQLQAELRQTRQQLQECEQNNQQLQQRVETLTAELRISQARVQALEQQAPRGTGISDQFFGLNAQLGIVAAWRENVDVDLWFRNTANNQWVSFQNRERPFGMLTEDLQSQTGNEALYELIYQRNLVPGTYEIWLHLYSQRGRATVNGYAILFPGRDNEKRINYGPIQLENRGNRPPFPPQGGVRVGTLIVTPNDIRLQ